MVITCYNKKTREKAIAWKYNRYIPVSEYPLFIKTYIETNHISIHTSLEPVAINKLITIHDLILNTNGGPQKVDNDTYIVKEKDALVFIHPVGFLQKYSMSK